MGRGCSVEGCSGKHFGKGYCGKHYANWRRHGSPVAASPRGLGLMQTLLARLPHRPEGQCWEWKGTFRGKYGVLKWNGKNQAAHRLMFFATYGYFPMETRHTCDNPPCCNPDHLLGGGRKENVADRVNRGRSARMPGRSNPNSRYTSEQVQSVRELTAQGLTGDAIAARTGINRNAVYRIRNGQN